MKVTRSSGSRNARRRRALAQSVGAPVLMLSLALAATAPSAEAAGRCGQHPWCDTTLSPDKRADLLIGAMNQTEKIDQLSGDEPVVPARLAGGAIQMYATDRYAYARGLPRLNIPDVYFADGPVGVNRDKATLLPSPVLLGATFNSDSAASYGAVLGDEVKKTGHDVSLAPAVDIVRTPLAGRAFETYGEDPFLNSQTAVPYIKNLQAQGVMANIKHFAFNNQEGQDGILGLPLTGLTGGRFFVNVNADDRAVHETYLPMYDAAIKDADVASVMCAYNLYENKKNCENKNLLDTILRGQLGFRGFVLSDFNAALTDAAGGLQAGTDLEMPWTQAYSQPNVNGALAAGKANGAQIDRALHNLYRTYFRFGLFDRAEYPNDRSKIDVAGHAATTGQIARDGTVLLRNERATLPLDTKRTPKIAVIGDSATKIIKGAGSGDVDPFSYVTALDGIRARAKGATVTYDDGSDPTRAAQVAKAADVAIVLTFQPSTEGQDQTCINLDCTGKQDALVSAVADAQPNNAVVLQTSSAVELPWLLKTGALIEAWYGGSDSGNALASVLFGDTDPAGRLPVTFPKKLADTPASGSKRLYPGENNQVFYDEGILVGYRWYDAKNIAPNFPFGFGLSYTTFDMTDLRVAKPDSAGVVRVGVTVKNTGPRAGSQVAQLYLGKPGTAALPQAPRSLAAFQKVKLKAGESRRLNLAVPLREFQSWNTTAKAWETVPGCQKIMVGTSSRDLPLTNGVNITDPTASGCTTTAEASATKPRLKVTVTPRRLTVARKAVAVRVLVRARIGGRLTRVRKALVRVGGKRVRTTAKGRATVRVRFTKPGTYRVRASAPKTRSSSTTIRALRNR